MVLNEETLSNAQKEAADTLSGPLLIIAGAGAGKTKTLTERIANLVRHGVPPGEILAITFTNKASLEMRERIGKKLSMEMPRSHIPFGFNDMPFIGTFHALGAFIIRENTERLGLPKFFSVYDRDDSKKLIKEAMETLSISPKEYEPGKILSLISRMKGDDIRPEEAMSKAKSDFHSISARVYGEYERLLKKNGALDFDDLLAKANDLLKNNPDILNKYHQKWTHIHIDEYQDTNEIQYSMAKLLAYKHKNICVVGDADQNIYSWRGASLKNILSFEQDYPGTKVVLLEENYRSTQKILNAANSVISKNNLRKEKKLFTKNLDGEQIYLLSAFDEATEAYFIAETIENMVSKGTKPNDIAVLFRANFQSRIFEETFLRFGIPYEITGTRFFERAEIKDTLSYLKLSLNQESFGDLARILNVPARSLGKVSLLKILAGEADSLPKKAYESYSDFKKIISDIKEFISTHTVEESIKFTLERSGILEEYERKARLQDKDAEERLENLRELVNVSIRYEIIGEEGLISFLTDAALQSGEDKNEESIPGVNLMTVHSAKGLEFDTVFIVGLEEGLFPHEKMYEEGITEEEREEERRLMYVAITRARKKLFLTFAQSRMVYGSREINVPSSFIMDIPSEDIEIIKSEYGGKPSLLTTIEL